MPALGRAFELAGVEFIDENSDAQACAPMSSIMADHL
jgi:hypothetical protein